MYQVIVVNLQRKGNLVRESNLSSVSDSHIVTTLHFPLLEYKDVGKENWRHFCCLLSLNMLKCYFICLFTVRCKTTK